MTLLPRLATQSGLLPGPRYTLQTLETRMGLLVTVYDTQNRDSEDVPAFAQRLLHPGEDPLAVLKALRNDLDSLLDGSEDPSPGLA